MLLKNKQNLKLIMTFILSILIIVMTTLSNSTITKAASANGQAIINEAMKHLGTPYRWGGTGPNAFDCSGFTQYVYRNATGIEIGRATNNQINSGREVSQSELKPGDLVFPHSGHVGIYIGNGQMIHAPQKGDVIKVSPIYKFLTARRIIEQNSTIEDLLFDTNFYSDKYSDLKKAFGNNSLNLRSHFLTFGINEGRSASKIFDASYYLSHNPDLINAFGANNYASAYKHFVNYGYKETRDLSPIFNLDYYIKNNPDIAKAYGNDYQGIMSHFLTYGMKEGRIASENFNINIYKNTYSDLKNAYGDNNEAYYNHYLIYGISEGRIAK